MLFNLHHQYIYNKLLNTIDSRREFEKFLEEYRRQSFSEVK